MGARPNGCFQYTVPETGVAIPVGNTTSIDNCVKMVGEYYRANGYAVPANLRWLVEEACCAKQAPGECVEDLRMPPAPAGITLTTALETVLQGTRTLVSWLTKGTVAREVAERRAAVCVTCEFNQVVDASGCAACGLSAKLNRLSQLVKQVIQRDEAPFDASLKACAVCHCNLSLKVRTNLDAILKYSPEAQLKQLPTHCWVKQEVL